MLGDSAQIDIGVECGRIKSSAASASKPEQSFVHSLQRGFLVYPFRRTNILLQIVYGIGGIEVLCKKSRSAFVTKKG